MSIIAMGWSSGNIVFCGDSRIHFRNVLPATGRQTRPCTAWIDLGRKVFHLPNARIGIVIAGSALIGEFFAQYVLDLFVREHDRKGLLPDAAIKELVNVFIPKYMGCGSRVAPQVLMAAGGVLEETAQIATYRYGVMRKYAGRSGFISNVTQGTWSARARLWSGRSVERTVVGFVQRYLRNRGSQETVGGPVDILCIRGVEGKWVVQPDRSVSLRSLSDLREAVATGEIQLCAASDPLS